MRDELKDCEPHRLLNMEHLLSYWGALGMGLCGRKIKCLIPNQMPPLQPEQTSWDQELFPTYYVSRLCRIYLSFLCWYFFSPLTYSFGFHLHEFKMTWWRRKKMHPHWFYREGWFYLRISNINQQTRGVYFWQPLLCSLPTQKCNLWCFYLRIAGFLCIVPSLPRPYA